MVGEIFDGGNVSGHIYLTGANETSSTSNTSQIVFGTSSNNHVALSSNNNALVINPTVSSTNNQIVLYLDKASEFPSGISANVTGNLTGTASRATADGNGNTITSTYATNSSLDSHKANKSNPHSVTCAQVGALPSGNVSGTVNYVPKFTGTNSIGNSGISDDGSTITLNKKVVLKGTGSSYNEGLRILPASNGWSEVFFSGDDSVSGTHDSGWLMGRRGAAGVIGAVGDFTIENNDSVGKGLTIHKNGNATIYGSQFAIGANKFSIQYDSSNQCVNFVFN